MIFLMIGLALAAAPLVQTEQPAPLTAGTATVELAAPSNRQTDAAALDAVSTALTDAGFLILPGEGHGRYIVRVTVTQDARGAVTTKGTSGAPLFAGNAASIATRAPAQLGGLVVTRLGLDLVTRDTGQVAWHGAALTAQVRGTAAGATATVLKKLADAIVRRFPEPMEQPVSVP